MIICMNYTGVIIEESLEDSSFLAEIKIISTKVEEATEKHRTPWIQQWTLHSIEIPEEKVDEIAQKISEELDKKHSWYADFKNNIFHYIVYRDKVFKVDLNNPILYKDAKAYGIFLGIPSYQVDFAPTDTVWKR